MKEVLRGKAGGGAGKSVPIFRRKGGYAGFTGSGIGMEHSMFEAKTSMAGPQRLAKKAGGSLDS